MTRDRLIAIRRFLTFEEPCDPPMAKEEIDVILRLAEQRIESDERWDDYLRRMFERGTDLTPGGERRSARRVPCGAGRSPAATPPSDVEVWLS